MAIKKKKKKKKKRKYHDIGDGLLFIFGQFSFFYNGLEFLLVFIVSHGLPNSIED